MVHALFIWAVFFTFPNAEWKFSRGAIWFVLFLVGGLITLRGVVLVCVRPVFSFVRVVLFVICFLGVGLSFACVPSWFRRRLTINLGRLLAVFWMGGFLMLSLGLGGMFVG